MTERDTQKIFAPTGLGDFRKPADWVVSDFSDHEFPEGEVRLSVLEGILDPDMVFARALFFKMAEAISGTALAQSTLTPLVIQKALSAVLAERPYVQVGTTLRPAHDTVPGNL